jgi:integrase
MSNGCRALTDSEIKAIISNMEDLRDRALFVLGVKSGFRISELLSLKVGDIWAYGEVLDEVSVHRRNMKGNHSGRSVKLHRDAKLAISQLIVGEGLAPESYLFRSRKGPNNPITRIQAWRVFKGVTSKLRMKGKVATHSMRKTFASKVYDILEKDLIKTQRALGHKSINSTVSYLSFRQEEIDDAVLST